MSTSTAPRRHPLDDLPLHRYVWHLLVVPTYRALMPWVDLTTSVAKALVWTLILFIAGVQIGVIPVRVITELP